ncbi:hypothetical protein CR513_17433, partial [Mucuna pruriens]
MIPVEIGEPSPKRTLFEPSKNEEELRANLDPGGKRNSSRQRICRQNKSSTKGNSKKFQNRRLSPKENHHDDQQKQAHTTLGRAVQNNKRNRKRGLQIREPRKKGTTANMERRFLTHFCSKSDFTSTGFTL